MTHAEGVMAAVWHLECCIASNCQGGRTWLWQTLARACPLPRGRL